MPKRISASAENTPEGAVYVGEDTLWVNRYEIGTHSNHLGRAVQTLEEALHLYEIIVWNDPDGQHMTAYLREQLRGKDLACDCPLDRPCHADVLLRLANT